MQGSTDTEWTEARLLLTVWTVHSNGLDRHICLPSNSGSPELPSLGLRWFLESTKSQAPAFSKSRLHFLQRTHAGASDWNHTQFEDNIWLMYSDMSHCPQETHYPVEGRRTKDSSIISKSGIFCSRGLLILSGRTCKSILKEVMPNLGSEECIGVG